MYGARPWVAAGNSSLTTTPDTLDLLATAGRVSGWVAGGRTMTVTVAVPLRAPSFAVSVSVATVDSVTLGAVQVPERDVGRAE